VPPSFRWPPKGSPGGRWRCLRRFGGPRRGRRVGGGGPSATPSSLQWPPEGSLGGRWRCRRRCSGPRRGRWAGGGVGRVPFGGGWCSEERRGAVRGRRWGSEELRWCSALRRGAARCAGGCSEERPWCAGWPRCLQIPASPARRAPDGGWVVGPVVRLAAPPRGVGSSGRGRASRALPREGGGGSRGGSRGLRCRLSEEGRRCGRLRRVRPPEGGWARVGPWWRCGLGGASPVRSVLLPGFGLPEKVERVHRGGDVLSPGAASWLPRRGGAVRSALARRRRSAGPLLRRPALARRCRSTGLPLRSASAPPVPKRRWGVGGAPPWVVRAPEGGWATLRRASWALAGPRADRSPCFAEALQGRHARSTEVGRGPTAAETVAGSPLKAVRRSAWPSVSLSRAEARAGSSLSRAEARAGRGRVLSLSPRQAAGLQRGSLPRSGARQGDGRLSGGGWNHLP